MGWNPTHHGLEPNALEAAAPVHSRLQPHVFRLQPHVLRLQPHVFRLQARVLQVEFERRIGQALGLPSAWRSPVAWLWDQNVFNKVSRTHTRRQPTRPSSAPAPP